MMQEKFSDKLFQAGLPVCWIYLIMNLGKKNRLNDVPREKKSNLQLILETAKKRESTAKTLKLSMLVWEQKSRCFS